MRTLLGYARVSTAEQNADLRVDELTADLLYTRDLPLYLNSDSEHLLDWFHVTLAYDFHGWHPGFTHEPDRQALTA